MRTTAPPPARTPPGDEPLPDDTRARILDAARRQCEDSGLRRTTMDDIARRAGLARVTLYRHFQSKEAIVQAVVLGEVERFFAALDAAIAPHRRAGERLVEGFAFALRFLSAHPLLQRLLRTEPESVLPYLTGASPVVSTARAAVVERLADRELDDPLRPRDAEAAAEVVVRVVHSFVLSPDGELGLDTPRGARRFARAQLARMGPRP